MIYVTHNNNYSMNTAILSHNRGNNFRVVFAEASELREYCTLSTSTVCGQVQFTACIYHQCCRVSDSLS